MNHEIYIAYSGLQARAQALEVAANNMSNLSVPGYKRDRIQYTTFNRVRAESLNELERAAADALVSEKTVTDFGVGTLVGTGNPLDLALSGDGFFTLETPVGVRYTRNGNFTVGPEGHLVSSQGHRVLGDNGPILVGERAEVDVGPTGEISVDGVQVGRLRVVGFERLQDLRKEGAGMFAAPREGLEIPPSDPGVRQGYLEQANLDPMRAVAEMISLMRSFETLTQAIRSISTDVNKKVIDEIGRAR